MKGTHSGIVALCQEEFNIFKTEPLIDIMRLEMKKQVRLEMETFNSYFISLITFASIFHYIPPTLNVIDENGDIKYSEEISNLAPKIPFQFVEIEYGPENKKRVGYEIVTGLVLKEMYEKLCEDNTRNSEVFTESFEAFEMSEENLLKRAYDKGNILEQIVIYSIIIRLLRGLIEADFEWSIPVKKVLPFLEATSSFPDQTITKYPKHIKFPKVADTGNSLGTIPNSIQEIKNLLATISQISQTEATKVVRKLIELSENEFILFGIAPKSNCADVIMIINRRIIEIQCKNVEGYALSQFQDEIDKSFVKSLKVESNSQLLSGVLALICPTYEYAMNEILNCHSSVLIGPLASVHLGKLTLRTSKASKQENEKKEKNTMKSEEEKQAKRQEEEPILYQGEKIYTTTALISEKTLLECQTNIDYATQHNLRKPKKLSDKIADIDYITKLLEVYNRKTCVKIKHDRIPPYMNVILVSPNALDGFAGSIKKKTACEYMKSLRNISDEDVFDLSKTGITDFYETKAKLLVQFIRTLKRKASNSLPAQPQMKMAKTNESSNFMFPLNFFLMP